MKKRILFSASLFHAVNDAATVSVPLIFPILYDQGFIITRYSHIGILSYLGLMTTLLFQVLVAHWDYKYENKHILIFSITGLSLAVLALTRASTFGLLLAAYLVMRFFSSFYHPIGVSWVSKSHPGRGLDMAMGIQSGSGNMGVFIAFLTVGYMAQRLSWREPLMAYSAIAFVLGWVAFAVVRRTTSRPEVPERTTFSTWKAAAREVIPFVPGFLYGGSCWAGTVYYAPSLFNHKFQIPIGRTGLYMALWIGLGSLVTYLFGPASRKIGRWRMTMAGLIGSTVFLFLMGTARSPRLAEAGLFGYGFFLFMTYPAFQSFVGNAVAPERQTVAFSLVANVQMLVGAVVGLASGFLSDALGISSPFIFLGFLGLIVTVFYLVRPRPDTGIPFHPRERTPPFPGISPGGSGGQGAAAGSRHENPRSQ